MNVEVGIIGGTGLYSLFESASEKQVLTAYGHPSDSVSIGKIAGRSVAFLPRHGKDNRYPPHKIPYKANISGLYKLGVRQILSSCDVSSLQPNLKSGSFVVPDQLVDQTTTRDCTFHDDSAIHVSFADPYCEDGREAMLKSLSDSGIDAEPSGTVVVVQGQRHPTRAESQWYASFGWELVNMTSLPEAVLARELSMCYTSLALVSDLEAGADSFDAIDTAKKVLIKTVSNLPKDRNCACSHALDGLL